MKLNSIIYDTNTLANAITEQLIDESPTFNAMYPSETSTALVNLLAGYGSMLQYTIVSAIANCYTDTAFSTPAIYQLAETLGNRLHGNVSSQLYCNITRTSLKGKDNVVIPRNSVFQVEGIPFFNQDPIIFPRDVDVINNVLLTQGEYVTEEFYTSGIAGERFYFSSDFKCNMNMVKVYVKDQEWDTTDSFLGYNAMQLIDQEQSNTVVLRMASDGRAYIKIGNNSNGTLPTSGTKIRIEYVSNEGANGNIEKTNMDAQLMSPIYYVDNAVNTLLTVDIITPQPAYGGYNAQSTAVLRESSPYIFASGNRAVRRDDYKALLLNKCGYMSANVWGEYEEAQMQGGYDKIMMNTVYYTGIKEIQKYNYRSIGTLDIIDSVDGVNPENPVYFTNTLGSIRGFPGSYEIDLIYSVDDSKQIKYTDKNGNGILVCDPSDNDEWEDGDGSELYPYDDGKKLFDDNILTVEAKQETYTDPETGISHNAAKLFDNNDIDFISNGTYVGGAEMRISFDTPLQIELLFPGEPVSVSMFSFLTPSEKLENFPGTISIYATNEIEDPDSSFTKNIKNNSEWTRIAEVQKVNVPEKKGVWSDWITTNLYDPSNTETTLDGGNGWHKYKRYMIEIYDFHKDETPEWGEKCYIGQLKFLLNEAKSERYAWGGITQNDETTVSPLYYTKSSSPVVNDPVYDSNLAKMADYVVSRTDTAGGVQFLVTKNPATGTEYTEECSAAKTGRNTEQDKTKTGSKDNRALDHRTSTINYENNSLADLCIPELQEDMDYYKYDISITGLTSANNYKTNDVLTYSFDNGTYANVRVTNINTNSYEVSINNSIGAITNSDSVQTGNRKLEVSDVDLTYVYGSRLGSGAKLTISSQNAIGVYGTFIGNAYSTATAQSIDSPIIEQYNHFTTYTEFKQPRVKNVKVEVTIEYSDSYSYKDTKKKVEEAIYSIFDVTPYYVGKSLNVSDIWEAINKVAGVKRFMVTTPTENIECKPYEFISLPENNLKIIDKFSEDFK